MRRGDGFVAIDNVAGLLLVEQGLVAAPAFMASNSRTINY